MDMSKTIKLVNVTYTTDSIGQKIPTETTTEVFCSVTSISATEWHDAGRNGLKPEHRVIVYAHEYDGQTTVELDQIRYGVYRTYRTQNDFIELYLERKAGA